MGDQASIESFEALRQLRTAVCRFAEVVGAGLDEADAELQRAGNWVKHEQTAYWKRESQRRAELVVQAKSALTRKKMQKTALGSRPSCVEEEKALALALRRVEEAKQKTARVRHWTRKLDEEVYRYQAVAGGLSQSLAIDVPNALAQLDAMLTSLEAYATSIAPQLQGSESARPPTESAAAAGVASMARAAPTEPGDLATYRQLRASTPPASVRASAPLVESGAEWRDYDLAASQPSANLDALNLPPAPPLPDDRIVVARGAALAPRVYMERLAATAPGDSGWCIGAVDAAAPAGYDALRVADFLAVRPDLQPVLALPPGYLVVLDGDALEVLLDANDNRLLPASPPAARDVT
jgi:hypothetical protein